MIQLTVTHRPGRHCASTGIRDLANYHGVQFSEAMCFGLGAGLGIWYLDFEGLPASRMIHVRSLDIEARFFSRMDLPFEWEQTDDPAAGEAALCRHLDNGRPAVIQTDIYYLPHYSGNPHFPGHLVTVWGYDPGEKVFFITDTGFSDILLVPFEDMRKARFFRNPIFDLRGNLYAPESVHVPPDMPGLIRGAVLENSRALTQDISDNMGLRALERMRAELPLWRNFDDWPWTCRFAYQVIEKRGTGGGAFRLMYADFLAEAARYVPEIMDLGLSGMMRNTGRAWQELAAAFKSASGKDEPDFSGAAEKIDAVIQAESAYHQTVCQKLSNNR